MTCSGLVTWWKWFVRLTSISILVWFLLLPFYGHNNSKIGFLLHVSVAVLHVLSFIKLIYISALSIFFFFLRICKWNSPTFRLNSNYEKEHQVNLVIYILSPISLQRFNPLAHYLLTYELHDPKKVNWNWRLTFIVCPIIKHYNQTSNFVTGLFVKNVDNS